MSGGVDTGMILVAEPDEGSRVVISGLLRETGHTLVEAVTGEEAIEAARRHRPRLAILEISLPGICGYEVCRRFKEDYGDSMSIVFLSGTRTEAFDRVGGMLLGADDYICKPLAADQLLASIGRLMRRRAPNDERPRLSHREREVLALLTQGLTQKEIAGQLTISSKTVGTHIEHIFSKLGVRNRLQAVAHAHRHELVSAPANLRRHGSRPLGPL
jgi:DNA-binding NarL/FixJ family response regulator